jgi:hypothetical protein
MSLNLFYKFIFHNLKYLLNYKKMNMNDLRNDIDKFRRIETELFNKLHSQETRKEEIFKIKKFYQRQHKTIQQLINNYQILYDTQLTIEELEKKK